jgi:PAS domain S-box-containing protein
MKYDGSVGILIDYDYIAEKYLENIKIGHGGYALAISKKGIELYSPIRNHVGKPVDNNYKDAMSLLFVVKKMERGEEGIADYLFNNRNISDANGELYHAAFYPVHLYNTFWSICVTAPESQILSHINGFRNRCITMLFLVVVIGFGFFLYLFRFHTLRAEQRVRDKTEEVLRESEARLESILESIQAGVMVVDIETNRIVDVNRAAADLIGAPKEKIVGQVGHKYFRPTEQGNCPAGGDGGTVHNAEGLLLAEDGSKKHVLKTTAPVELAGRTVLLESIIDITERRLAEEALRESEEKFRSAFQSSPDSICLNRFSDGIFLDINEGFTKNTGYSRDQVIGKTALELDTWHDLEDRKHVLEALGSAGFVENVEARFNTKSGETKIGLMSARVIHINKEDVILSITRDITYRKQTEDALRESEEINSAIVNQATEGIVLIDSQTLRFVEFNDAACNGLGYSREEFARLTLSDIQWGLTPDELTERVREVVEAGHAHFENQQRRKDGSLRDVMVSNRAICIRDRKYLVGLWLDITGRKRMEEELRLSEGRLRRAEVAARFGNWEFIVECGRVKASEGARIIYGVEGDEWSIAEVQSIPLPEYRGMLDTALIGLIEEGKPYNVEFKIRRPTDGKVIDIHSIAEYSPERGAVFGVIQDITERKRAEEERIRLATAIEQAAEAIFVTTPDWIIQYANPAFESLTGYSKREIIGRHTRILRSYQHDNAFYGNMRDTLARAEVWSGRIINRKKNGTFYDAEVTVSPVRDKSGTIINYVSIHRDITREVRLEAELYQARKMEAIGLLAGGIAHDFNNILAAIMGFTELSLFKIPEDSPVRGNLEQVLKASARASEVVKQILTFTRHGVQERKRVGIASIVQESLKLLRSSLPSTIEIHQEVAVMPGEDVVMADPGQIHQVLMNLGTNAGHAMRTRGGTLTVKLSVITDASLLPLHSDLKATPHVLCISVSDTGHGIDSAIQERIFDPYFTTKGPGEGTGLGLSVVQGIVKSHGGEITVLSEPGKSTIFFVFLPGLEGVDEEDTRVSQAPPTGSERILFVDDEETLVELGLEMLEKLGYRVTARTSSSDALEIFRAQPDAFDLVITDMTMPSLTGKELAEKIIALRPDTPIILSTGFSELVNEKQAKEAGIREFVMKPYEIRTLADVIRKALSSG